VASKAISRRPPRIGELLHGPRLSCPARRILELCLLWSVGVGLPRSYFRPSPSLAGAHHLANRAHAWSTDIHGEGVARRTRARALGLIGMPAAVHGYSEEVMLGHWFVSRVTGSGLNSVQSVSWSTQQVSDAMSHDSFPVILRQGVYAVPSRSTKARTSLHRISSSLETAHPRQLIKSLPVSLRAMVQRDGVARRSPTCTASVLPVPRLVAVMGAMEVGTRCYEAWLPAALLVRPLFSREGRNTPTKLEISPRAAMSLRSCL